MGRGAHPSSFADRIAWALSTWSRRRFVRAGIRLEPEVSFQGGDGYLFFRTQLEGSLTLTGADYSWLYAQFQYFTCCAEVDVALFSDAEPGGLLLHEAYFQINAVEWIHHDCTAKVSKLLTRDAYDQLFRGWETEYNVLDPTGFTPLATTGFVADYTDVYSFEVNETTGVTEKVLPDGNEVGTVPNNIKNRDTGYKSHVYPRAYQLTVATDRLFAQTRKGLSNATRLGTAVASDFYTAAINPVTGRKNYTFIVAGASDIKRPRSINVQSQLTISLKDWLAELQTLHNVYWLIDDDGTLRLEHRSWFDHHSYSASFVPELDLTTLHPDVLAKNDTERYDLDELYEKEELTISYNSGAVMPEWVTGNVVFDDACVQRTGTGKAKVNSLTATRAVTDLIACYLRADKVPDSAIFFGEVDKLFVNGVGGFTYNLMPYTAPASVNLTAY